MAVLIFTKRTNIRLWLAYLLFRSPGFHGCLASSCGNGKDTFWDSRSSTTVLDVAPSMANVLVFVVWCAISVFVRLHEFETQTDEENVPKQPLS